MDRVAAIAGAHVILLSDVRTRAAVYTIGTEKDPLERARAEAKAMHAASEELIDAALVGDEAERLHITATEDEVDHAIDAVAKSANLDHDGLMAIVHDRHVEERDYRAMLRAQLLEGKILMARKANHEKIDDEARALHAELRARVYVEERIAAP